MADRPTLLAPLSSEELERLLSAPDHLMRLALQAEEKAAAAIANDSPVAAREWFETAHWARRTAKEAMPHA